MRRIVIGATMAALASVAAAVVTVGPAAADPPGLGQECGVPQIDYNGTDCDTSGQS